MVAFISPHQSLDNKGDQETTMKTITAHYTLKPLNGNNKRYTAGETVLFATQQDKSVLHKHRSYCSDIAVVPPDKQNIPQGKCNIYRGSESHQIGHIVS